MRRWLVVACGALAFWHVPPAPAAPLRTPISLGPPIPIIRSARLVTRSERAARAARVLPMTPRVSHQPRWLVSAPLTRRIRIPLPLLRLYRRVGRADAVPCRLLAAQDWVESRFDTTLVSPDPNGSIDRGVAQINSAAWPGVTWQDAMTPAWAVRWQAQHLRRWAREYGNWATALAVYNAGVPLTDVGSAWHARVAAYVAQILQLSQEGPARHGVSSAVTGRP